MFNRKSLVTVGVTAALAVSSACSSSDPDESLIVVATSAPEQSSQSTTAEPPSTTEPVAIATTSSTMPDLESLPLAEFEPPPPDAQLKEFVNPAMGGVRFSIANDHIPAVSHDSIIVFVEPNKFGPRSTAAIALVTQSVAGAEVRTVDDYISAVEGVEDAVVVPTGDHVELFGYRLRGYVISNGAELEEPMLFSSARFGAPVDTEFAPFPWAVEYLADTPAGVLVASLYGSDEANARAASAALGTLLATIRLTGPGLDEPLPPGEVVEPADVGPPPEPAALIDDGPPALETVFAPVAAGRYQLPNVGQQLQIDFDDSWFVQPNFPGFVVFTDPGSIGPGDRDVVVIADVVEYVPTEAGPRSAGDPTVIVDVDSLLSSPPSGFTASDPTVVELGNAQATRFDLRSDAGATCALGEPCEAALVTSYGFLKALGAGFDHRIWWIDNGDEPATVIIAMALAAPDFIERATALVDTIEFS